MAALSRDEFMAKTQNVKVSDTTNRDDWSGAAGSLVAAISINHENYSKETMVEALQVLALRMPTELVVEATMRMMTVASKMGR